MKHVTYGEKSLLVGDEAADLLMSYATVLGRNASTDSVTLRAIGPDGNETDATFLLNPSTTMVIESTNGSGSEPDNEFVNEYMRRGINRLTQSFEMRTDDSLGH
ncbi:hypothetical protein [Leifsonia sp. NPDC077715]|uniref:hypothetical protein n=1 Tax=Leifsonia sp. NPDC077715 TaxID=3155539 RepID=UPI003426EF73